MRDERTPKDVCVEAKDNYEDKILSILTSAHASTSVILAHKRGSRRHFFPSFSENIARTLLANKKECYIMKRATLAQENCPMSFFLFVLP